MTIGMDEDAFQYYHCGEWRIIQGTAGLSWEDAATTAWYRMGFEDDEPGDIMLRWRGEVARFHVWPRRVFRISMVRE